MTDSIKQAEFDFNKADRLGWINEAELPTGQAVDGATVAPQTMKHMLRAIENHLGKNEWAWPSQLTLASELGCTERTIRRATEALEAMSLLITQRRKNPHGTVSLHYRIVWTELAMLEPSRRARWRDLMQSQRASRSIPRSTDSDQTPRQVASALATTDETPRTSCVGPALIRVQRSLDRSDMNLPQPVMRSDRPDIEVDQPDIVTKLPDTMSGKPLLNHQPRTTPPPLSSSLERTWGEVEEEIRKLGVAKARECIAEARIAGVELHEIEAILARYRETIRAYRDHWQCPPYVLLRRIQSQRPGMDIAIGWIGGLVPASERNRMQVDRAREHSRESRTKLFETIHKPDRPASADDPEWIEAMKKLGISKSK